MFRGTAIGSQETLGRQLALSKYEKNCEVHSPLEIVKHQLYKVWESGPKTEKGAAYHQTAQYRCNPTSESCYAIIPHHGNAQSNVEVYSCLADRDFMRVLTVSKVMWRS